MTDEKLGGATEAAAVLDLSISQFNTMRLLATYIYDPLRGTTERVDPDRDDLREYLADKHLLAPTFAGHRYPGGRWKYNLAKLRKYQCNGWPGAPYDHPK